MVVSATTVRTWLRAASLGPSGTRGGDEVARVRPSALASHARGRFLHRRDDLAATTVCAVFHRPGQPPCARGGLHAESDCPVGDAASPATDVDAGRTSRGVPLPDSRPGPEIYASFDEVCRSSGLEIIRTPCRAPQANGVAERFVRTVRSECLDWLLILNDQHRERVLDVFVAHYNGHRPHRALALTPPCPSRPTVAPATAGGEARVQRRDRLGGVVHEYVLAA